MNHYMCVGVGVGVYVCLFVCVCVVCWIHTYESIQVMYALKGHSSWVVSVILDTWVVSVILDTWVVSVILDTWVVSVILDTGTNHIISSVYVCIFIQIDTFTMYIYIRTYAYINIYIHMYTHTYIFTHIGHGGLKRPQQLGHKRHI